MPDYPYLSESEKRVKWRELERTRCKPRPAPTGKGFYTPIDLAPAPAPESANERLLISAIKYPWNEVVTGLRHHHVIAHMASRGIKTPSSYPQGFVSSTGKFYERGEALNVAIESGQVAASFTGTLYSEDLW
ncbi:hypothetical protein [Dietzia natronolimnaea]|uniref:hypothetical protein n=1 Tax=Dietzia natronolimnaea TaxID=161920 RepID=UPI0015F7E69F|nr:hypothetical protein [Dietzia natronolimnaea]MBB1037384.1 hypothetical protein [Dietzia natronolimnaea]